VGTAGIAIVAIIVIIFGVIGAVQLASRSNISTVSSTKTVTTSQGYTSTTNDVGLGGGIVPLSGDLSTQNVSCLLASGVCAFTIVNNSTTPLELENCRIQVILNSNADFTTSGLVNGTLGGPALSGIPSDSQVAATCTAPTTQLSLQTPGSMADGLFTVKLVDNWYSYPAGTDSTFGFSGSWH